MVCVAEMNEIENANSGFSMLICILNGTQTSKHLFDSGKATETLPREGDWKVIFHGFGFFFNGKKVLGQDGVPSVEHQRSLQ